MEISKKLLIVEELIKTKRQVKEQIKVFIKMGCGTRRTFFHYKKILLQQKPELQKFSPIKSFLYSGRITQNCYFCDRQADIIHHINQDRRDNKNENLLALCKGCHNKIHRIYNSAGL